MADDEIKLERGGRRPRGPKRSRRVVVGGPRAKLGKFALRWPTWVDVLRAMPGHKPCRWRELRHAGKWRFRFGRMVDDLIAAGLVESDGKGLVWRTARPCPAYYGRAPRPLGAKPHTLRGPRERERKSMRGMVVDMGGWEGGMGGADVEFIPGPRNELYGVFEEGPVGLDLADVLRVLAGPPGGGRERKTPPG